MLSLQLLGTFSASLDGRRVEGFATNKERALFAYLAVEADRPHPRDRLATLLWPDLPPDKARNNFRVTLHRLRQTVQHPHAEVIRATRETVGINPDVDTQVDANVLAQKLEAVREHDDGTGPCPACHARLTQAVELYGGPFLAGLTTDGSQPFDAWVRHKREWHHLRVLAALATLAQFHRLRGDSEMAQKYAHRQLKLEPWRERAHRQLMHTLACSGNYTAALAQFETCRQTLADELGVDPSPQTARLYEKILAARETRFRPLPNVQGALIGREQEIAQIVERLADPTCRLLTLFGPGGVGKSRLALAVARRQETAFLHGICHVPLAAVDSPDRLLGAIARAADYQFQNHGDRRSELLRYLEKKEMLLVLDNFEHLVSERELLPALLDCAPGLKVLVTSRIRLNLKEEQVIELQGLAYPEQDEGEEPERYGAVKLFMDRAKQVQPGFELSSQTASSVSRLCRYLAGIPLAIELAASWSRVLAPQQILSQIRDSIDFLESPVLDERDRHRSMRACFEHSWLLLDDERRDALMKLSLFRGGFDVEAAQEVTGASLRTLTALVDRSLLAHDVPAGRLHMHELLRNFAGDKLRGAGQTGATRDAHSAYYLKVLARVLPDLKGPDQLGALDAIDADIDNVRAAWRRAVTRGHWAHFPEASQSLCLFSLFRSRHNEGIELLQMASAAAREQPRVHAYLLAARRMLELVIGRRDEARTAVPVLRTAAEEQADPAAAANCCLVWGWILGLSAEPDEAIPILARARTYYDQVQDPFYGALTLWREGMAHFRAERRQQTLEAWQHGLALARSAGDRYITGCLLHNLAAVTANWEGESEVVERYYREARNLRRQIGARSLYAHSLGSLAGVLSRREGGVAGALPLLEKALAVATAHDITYVKGQLLGALAWYRLRQGKHEECMVLTAEALSFTRQRSFAWARACAVRGIALLTRDDAAHAAPLFSDCFAAMVADPGLSHLGSYLPYVAKLIAERGELTLATELLACGAAQPNFRAAPELKLDFSQLRVELKEKLGEGPFAAAWEHGKKLDPMDAAGEVLEALELTG